MQKQLKMLRSLIACLEVMVNLVRVILRTKFELISAYCRCRFECQIPSLSGKFLLLMRRNLLLTSLYR